jgi:hypothetical protein
MAKRRRRSELAALAGALLLGSACAITRVYVGTALPTHPTTALTPGVATRADVLRELGAPDQVLRHTNGDVFIYRYNRKNEDVFTIEEPVITDLQLFQYTRVDEREDRLIVIFDAAGVVDAYGYHRGTEEID